MTASSQTPPGALPPESPYTGPPLPDPVPMQAAVASFAVALPVPVGSPALVSADVPAHLVVYRPEPLLPMCVRCGNRKGRLVPDGEERYASDAQVLVCSDGCLPGSRHAATRVLTAAMKEGHTAPAELADAEESAGILFDPQRAQDIATAAREQGRAESAAETDALREENASLLHFKKQLDGIRGLLAGRPDGDLMMVREILAAADSRTPTGAPLVVTWDGIVMGPSGDTENETTLVPCMTAHGAPAALVLDDDQRQALASLLGLTVRDITPEGNPMDGGL